MSGYVVVKLVESHDGQACECIRPGEHILAAGDTLTLTHTRINGRDDKVDLVIVSVGAQPEKEAHAEVQDPHHHRRRARRGDRGTTPG